MNRRTILGLLLVLPLSAAAPQGVCSLFAGEPGPVPDGVYTLMKISGGSLINLGTVEIRKTTYRFGDEGKFASFKIDKEGNITWSGPLNFLPDGWKHEKSVYAGKNKEGKPMMKIHYLSARGTPDIIDAVKE